LDNIEEISVYENIFNIFKNSKYFGIYYAGKPEDGDIFNFYFSNYFELEFQN